MAFKINPCEEHIELAVWYAGWKPAQIIAAHDYSLSLEERSMLTGFFREYRTAMDELETLLEKANIGTYQKKVAQYQVQLKPGQLKAEKLL